MPRIQFNESRKQGTYLLTGICALFLFAIAYPGAASADATSAITFRIVTVVLYLGLGLVFAWLAAYVGKFDFFLVLRILVVVFTMLGCLAQLAQRARNKATSKAISSEQFRPMTAHDRISCL